MSSRNRLKGRGSFVPGWIWNGKTLEFWLIGHLASLRLLPCISSEMQVGWSNQRKYRCHQDQRTWGSWTSWSRKHDGWRNHRRWFQGSGPTMIAKDRPSPQKRSLQSLSTGISGRKIWPLPILWTSRFWWSHHRQPSLLFPWCPSLFQCNVPWLLIVYLLLRYVTFIMRRRLDCLLVSIHDLLLFMSFVYILKKSQEYMTLCLHQLILNSTIVLYCSWSWYDWVQTCR